MKTLRILLTIAGALIALVGIAPAAGATPPPDPGSGMTPMIIGGGNATSGPWAARLFFNGRQQCSATIIAPTYILTARHCVSGSGTYTFRIGSLDQTSGGTLATGTTIFRETSGADLAIVRLDRSVSATYARLGAPGSVTVGQTVQVYGWGATCTGQPEINCQSQFLKVANVVVTGGCTDAFGGRAICARRGNGITAGGDSGGPMNANGIQVGVASTSDRATTTAYTNVTRYRTWIQSVAGV